MQTIENAQRRLDEAATQLGANPGSARLGAAFNEAGIAAEQAGERMSARFVGPVLAGFVLIAAAAREAVDEYAKFAGSVMNLRDITGSSGSDAARAETVFRGFGIKDTQAMRDMLRLSRDTMTPKGQESLKSLGIDPKGGATGLALLNQVADGLEKISSGTKKAALEQQIFGVRGVDAFLPYLRAGKEARDAMAGLSTVTEENLRVSQQFAIAQAMLGATWEQRVVFPIISLVMPALVGLVNGLTWVVGVMGQVNTATHGIAGFAVVLVILAAGTVAFAMSLQALAGMLGITSVALMAQNGVLAIRDALMGPAGWAALAVAGTVGLAIGGFSAWNAMHPGDPAQDAHTGAMKDHTAALKEHADNLSKMNHGGIPEGLNRYDIQQLSHQRALGAIG